MWLCLVCAVSLIVAAAAHTRSAAELLVAAGAPLGTATLDGFTPLHHASAGGHAAAVRFLAGVAPELLGAKDMAGRTALECAAAYPAVLSILSPSHGRLAPGGAGHALPGRAFVRLGGEDDAEDVYDADGRLVLRKVEDVVYYHLATAAR
eukprot:TRINITY_DN3240_c0_g1_i2.p4 TRINITY_DN3240_c0_g1~~TRINITY_DN3240_c0_g1_i2.p4  ORF type:complete len:150 (+),score=33.50 TRINITY_DN3240_c0_g1_i2:445-894(+)